MTLKSIKCRAKVVLPIIATSILMTACGGGGGGEEGKKSSIMSLGIYGVIMLLITALYCVSAGTALLVTSTSQERGTNSVSRYLRHNKAYKKQRRAMGNGAFCLIIDLIGIVLHFTIPRLIITMIPVGIIVYAQFLMKKGTESKERVQATRDITKAGITAGKGVAVVGAAAGGTIAAPLVAGAVGVTGAAALLTEAGVAGAAYMAGHEIAKGAERVHAVMEDVDRGREVREFPELSDGYVISPDEFLKKAVKLGLDTQTDLNSMANQIIALAPQASVAELPQDMDPVEKAARLVGAVQKADGATAIEQKSQTPAIEGEYREVSET